MLLGFLLGCYTMGALVTFLVIGAFCVLGGKDEDMWKPFAWAIAWPVLLPLVLAKKVQLP